VGVPTPPGKPPRDSAAGSVLTAFEGSTALLFVFGDIDATTPISLGFDRPLVPDARQPQRIERVVVDLRHMTSCDLTLVSFLASVVTGLPVTVRHAQPPFLDMLEVAGIRDLVQVDAIDVRDPAVDETAR
jgi:hypothetical protein